MRALLISANTEQLQMPVLPMGLACVAEAARRAGHDVRLLNLMTRDDLLDLKLEETVSSFNPEIIGVSVRNIDNQSMNSPKFLLESVKNVVSSCRGLSRAPVVLGGAGYSIYPRSALAYLGADMGIRGEGETAFVKLLDSLSRGNGLADVPNLVFPGSVRENRAETVKHLDDSPLPVPNGLFSFPTEFEDQTVWLPFQTRRGCPMKCSYCSTAAIEGTLLRKRSPSAAVDSLRRFADAGFRNFFLVDNTFNFPSSYASDLCDRIIAENLGIKLRCILYPWNVAESLVEKLAAAGCADVSLGFESGSKKVLRSLNKKFLPEEVRAISEMLKRHGIGRIGFLLLGGPGETRETVLESLEFADSLELEAMQVTIGIRIYPQTALAAAATAEGIVKPDDDLLLPRFYLAKGLEGWIEDTVSAWLETRPGWHS